MTTIARKQTLVQLSDELVTLLDQRAAREGKSRSAVIREAINAHLFEEWDEEVARQYREAYTRMPQTEEELAWADFGLDAHLRALEAEEGEDGF